MTAVGHDIRRKLLAFVLLVVFMIPLVVKSVHVCPTCAPMPLDKSHAVVFQTPAHDAATCPVCLFSFISFDKADNLVFHALTFVSVAVVIGFLAVGHARRQVSVISLRAPPVL